MNAAMTTNNGQTNKKTQKPHANSTQNRYATGVVQNLGTKLSHGTTWLGQHRHIWPLTTEPETMYVAKQNETQNSGTTSNCVTRAKGANHPWCLSPLKTRAVQQQTYSTQRLLPASVRKETWQTLSSVCEQKSDLKKINASNSANQTQRPQGQKRKS